MTEPKRLTDEELATIKQRAERATKGLMQKHRKEFFTPSYIYLESNHMIVAEGIENDADAELFMHAREDVLRLVEEVRRLRRIAEQYERLQDTLDELPIDIEDLIDGN